MPASLLSEPSIRKLLARGRVPYTEKEVPFVKSAVVTVVLFFLESRTPSRPRAHASLHLLRGWTF